MRIGIPTEVKPFETRVSATPALVSTLTNSGNVVRVQQHAGEGAGFEDADYAAAGAEITSAAADVWNNSDLIIKVKEPIASEYNYFRQDLTIFSYLHLAANAELTEALLRSGCTAMAFETVQLPDRSLPLLTPMSEIAGRLSMQIGADLLTAPHGGRGVLLGGITGVQPGSVVVIGAGAAGAQAVDVAIGMQGQVTVIDRDLQKLHQIEQKYSGRVVTIAASEIEIANRVARADLVVTAALVAGARAPVLVTNQMIATMAQGSVIVDIAIDQGGNSEPARQTTHAEPAFTSGPARISCISNLPAAVPRTATYALSNAIAPFVLDLAMRDGVPEPDSALAAGVNIAGGKIVHPALLTKS